MNSVIFSDKELKLSPNSLARLEEIDLSRSTISFENLDILLKAAPNLKKIILDGSHSPATQLQSPSSFNLSRLEEINLSGTSISFGNLDFILHNAPNLKKISLSGANQLNQAIHPLSDMLVNLEEIDLSGSNISRENLEIILRASPKLRKICLRSCKTLDLGQALNLTPDSLANLEEIDLSSSSISCENLESILRASPKLRKICLQGLQNQSQSLHLKDGSLSRLNWIELTSSNISCANLAVMLGAAPRLKKISLKNQTLGESLKLTPDSLFSLEQIDIYDSNISKENLDIILKAAPNLRNSSKESIQQLMSPQQSQKPLLHSSPHYSPVIAAGGGRPVSSPTNPIHDSRDMRDFKPNDRPFQFKGENKTLNQGMLIEKLCQYWTLSGNPSLTRDYQKIQNGMCMALANLFLNIEKDKWDNAVNSARDWDGTNKNLTTDLQYFFMDLTISVQNQFSQTPSNQYIGDALNTFLASNQESCILFNPWHEIAIKPAQNGNWYVYDPNYVTGYQEIAANKLPETIKNSLGGIVSIYSEKSLELSEVITDPNYFIEHGGLLALCQCENAGQILDKLPIKHEYSKKALDGILLRSTSGKPAWVYGLASQNHEIKVFTHILKTQFEAQNADAVEQLTKSIETLTAKQKGECIQNMIQASSSPREAENLLINAIKKSARLESYEMKLQTWNKAAPPPSSVLEYCQSCLSTDTKKRLIELDSTQHVDALGFLLEEFGKKIRRPIFYLENPSDLICSAPWMQINPEDHTGSLHKGPGGALYMFLQENISKNPVLIVNYERFEADEIVRFNGLLDNPPNADGVPLPEGTQIIGLINRNKPDCYQGSDFYSRFDSTKGCPLTLQQLDETKPARTVEVSEQDVSDVATINLYHSHDWQNRLLGRWVLDGDQLTFSEGELTKALKDGKPIQILNGNWGDEAFERFWRQALTSQVRHGGNIINIPQEIRVFRPAQERYHWENKLSIFNRLSDDETAVVLNPGRLGDFIGCYALQDSKLMKQPGLIEQRKEQRLIVNITRTLPDDAWAILLDECKNHKVILEVHAASGVKFPKGLIVSAKDETYLEPIMLPFDSEKINQGLIISTDIDTSVAMLQRKDSYNVIDVSECSPSDLLDKWDGRLNPETLKFEFSHSCSVLETVLSANKKIILKGYFSPELMDALAPLLLRHQRSLILITDDATTVDFLQERYFHKVDDTDKQVCLEAIQKDVAEKQLQSISSTGSMYKPQEYTEPLTRLVARSMHLALNPTGTCDDAWLGMKTLSGGTTVSSEELDIKNSEAECTAFTQARLTQVNAVLNIQPYVFLTGLTGVGKSTFVETELCKEDILYQSENDIENWALDATSEKRLILFIDEANLSHRQWTEFEGLYQKPPNVLVNGKLYPLTQNHKVVFAGNPVNYGDERVLAPFFERHGNAVLFTPLTPAVIYEKILKPVFENTQIQIHPIAEQILEVYRFVCQCSTTEILISPRELQMMALMFIANAASSTEKRNSEHFIYTLARNLVPESRRLEFDKKFPRPSIEYVSATKDVTYLVTESRFALSQQLNDLLELREWRRKNQTTLNTVQKAGGLGGLIIEGAPGIGKSEQVIASLRARGYEQEHDFDKPTIKDKLFYRMSVSMTLTQKQALLVKAFNEGAVVMIDEINSSPMMERLLNDLLMGKKPGGQQEGPVKPGFMIIATQNPVTMAGRRAPSTAILRRCITHDLPEYHFNEIVSVLISKGITFEVAEEMTKAYEKNRDYAIKNQLSPVPNLRNLIQLADEMESKSNECKSSTTQRLSNMSFFSADNSDKTTQTMKYPSGN